MIFNQSILKILSALYVILVLLGCSTYPRVNKDASKNNTVTFQRDALECAEAYPSVGSGGYIKERISCMNLKGWY